MWKDECNKTSFEWNIIKTVFGSIRWYDFFCLKIATTTFLSYLFPSTILIRNVRRHIQSWKCLVNVENHYAFDKYGQTQLQREHLVKNNTSLTVFTDRCTWMFLLCSLQLSLTVQFSHKLKVSCSIKKNIQVRRAVNTKQLPEMNL